MIFYIVPFIFLSTVCFGMEQSSLQEVLHNDINETQQRIWELDFEEALIYADSSLLEQVIKSPYFTPEYVIEAPDLNGVMIDPITFSLLYTKKYARAHLPVCIEILHNNGIPLIVPQKDLPETFFCSFLFVKNVKDFQCLLRLHVQKTEKIIDPCHLKETGKNILEVEIVNDYPVFLDFISKAMESASLIVLYNQYKPNILNKPNLLRTAYLGFANTHVMHYAVENNLITTDIKIKKDPHFIKNIVPFLIANGAKIYQEVEGLSLDDIKYHILQIINGDPASHISSLPCLQSLSINIYQMCNLLRNHNIDLKPLIDVIEKSMPLEEELIKDAVRLALNVEANQLKTPSMRDVVFNKKNPINISQAWIARKYTNIASRKYKKNNL